METEKVRINFTVNSYYTAVIDIQKTDLWQKNLIDIYSNMGPSEINNFVNANKIIYIGSSITLDEIVQ